jgi:hypothetical protein
MIFTHKGKDIPVLLYLKKDRTVPTKTLLYRAVARTSTKRVRGNTRLGLGGLAEG